MRPDVPLQSAGMGEAAAARGRGGAPKLALAVYVHAPYLINVCSPSNNVRYGSRKILTADLRRRPPTSARWR